MKCESLRYQRRRAVMEERLSGGETFSAPGISPLTDGYSSHLKAQKISAFKSSEQLPLYTSCTITTMFYSEYNNI